MANWKSLLEKGFYFVGDSAYNLKSFLLNPYDQVHHGTPEDDFNFYQSSSRISVECAFGEIDMRWGIFWRPLTFKLKNNISTIDVCLRLHNFIVDYQTKHEVPASSAVDERAVFDKDSRRFLATQSNVGSYGVNGGEEELCRDDAGAQYVGRVNRGRPTHVETTTALEGKGVRDKVRDYIVVEGGMRPPSNWYKENNRMMDLI